VNFTVYRSSAGSGKTFTLVREYLRIALTDIYEPPQRYRKILAITFTNKAAAEMKDRIIRSLKELSSPEGKSSPMAKVLKEELQLDDLTLATRAQKVLRAILHNYTDFAIGTIDSFTHRIVRTFAHDLRLPVNFEVELDAEKLIREAVDVLIGKIGEDAALTELLVKFSSSRAEGEKNWQIEYQLKEIGGELVKEEGARHVELLSGLSVTDFMQIADRLTKSNKEIESRIVSLAKEAMKTIEMNGLTADDFSYGKNGIAGRLIKFSEGHLETFGEINKNVEKMFSGGKWNSAKASSSALSAIEAIKPVIENAWKKLEAIRENEFPGFIFHALLLKNIYAIAVLNELKNILHSFRSEQNILHISEFNRIISEIVFAEPVPFIYERLGEKYSNYLIDEFQDTSVVQWQNLLPLVENALAGNEFNMLVGDGKQSIYRWRGGDVEQFAKLPEVINPSENPLVHDREQSLLRNFKEKYLLTNYRSQSEIVKFNNSFFRELSGKLGAGSGMIYAKLEQEFVPEREGGYVRIEELEQSEEKNEIFISKTLERIESLVKEGWEYKDIAVLVKENKEGSWLAAAMIEKNIPVLSSDSLLLKNSAVVSFMVSILRCIEHPSDELASAQVLEYLSFTKRISLSLQESLKIYNETENDLQETFSRLNIDLDLRRSSRLPIYQRCEEIIAAFDLGKKPDSYLVFFLDEILNFTNSRGKDKNDFFSYWEDRSRNASVVVPESLNAVTVMTIHKSKGLEFPVVIIPFANWEIEKFTPKKWLKFSDPLIPELNTAFVSLVKDFSKTSFADVYEDEKDKTLLDSLNTLYVALTRAEKRLYIFTEQVTKTEGGYISYFFGPALEKINRPFIDHVSETGTISPPEKNSKATILCIRPDHLNSTKWEDRVQIRPQSAEIWEENDTQGKRDRGNLIHAILANITTAKDIDEAINEAVQNGLVAPGEISSLKELLNKLTNHPDLTIAFSGKGKIRRETELLLPDGSRLRPDRVVELENETIIIDYKTGIALPRHKLQMDGYGNMLRQMGYSSIKKKIVYTESLTVESW
jgi:ATP-dependent exoDNAse (exonuclease V) beta subunit